MRYIFLLTLSFLLACGPAPEPIVDLEEDTHLVLIGNNLCSRMHHFGYFETSLFASLPDSRLTIRNLCDGGNTPGFRPHSGRQSPWAFPGAADFQTEYAQPTGSQGDFPSEDEWLTQLEADVLLAFFGYSESFGGREGLTNFALELDTFIRHTLARQYNGKSAPQLVLVSPIAFQDLSDSLDLPDGNEINENLALYTRAMGDIAADHDIPFINLFEPSMAWYEEGVYTIDGLQLNDAGYRRLADFLARQLLGVSRTQPIDEPLLAAVREKNWFWHNDFKIPNGVHVFGRRYEPYGPDNYPMEVAKVRQMTHNRDTAIWAMLQNDTYDLTSADARTPSLPEVETNYRPAREEERVPGYLYEEEAMATFDLPPGYQIELFAGEQEFPELANPVQLSFDDLGRLWVAVMPSYPHYRPGDERPNDKLLILEDTDNDGKADKVSTFADGLHLPVGFEFARGGVFLSQGTDLIFLKDTDGDDRADYREVVLSGFDDHDTHHNISAYAADPSGAFYMGEGVFLHTNVETPYGTVRGSNGGFYRYNPRRRRLERTAQVSIPNPWGVAFDDFSQPFFLETSSPNLRWMLPSTIKPRYGQASPMTPSLVQEDQRVRPTSGIEFVSSRHFPDEVQGDLIYNNTIGFLGTKQHMVQEDGVGYRLRYRQDLLRSSDKNFRPVDLEFAPDGSLYVVDWHNVLIGHMQHNARDPLRDHVHGRVYRITYPSRPLVPEPKVAGATESELFENLKLPEFRARYRSRRALTEKDSTRVARAAAQFLANLDPTSEDYDRLRLEALWVGWARNEVNWDLLNALAKSSDHRIRAAAARVVRYVAYQRPEVLSVLQDLAADPHGRVRLEAIVAASWLGKKEGNAILDIAEQYPLDQKWMLESFTAARAHLNDRPVIEEEEAIATNLQGEARQQFGRGQKIYLRDGNCATCHQENGKGLAASGYPPLAGTRWAMGDEERLIKLTLHGLYGPIEVLGKEYPGTVPMTAYAGLLDDQEIADVLTYVRNSFGNVGSVIKPETVAKVRSATQDRQGTYSPTDLLKEYPMK